MVTIGILAVLATVVVLVLNPAELFRQARDSRRLQDLGSINGAINLYLAFSSNPDLDGTQSNCNAAGGLGSAACTCSLVFWASAPNAEEQFAAVPVWAYVTPSTNAAVNGTGWIPMEFSTLIEFGGSPLSSLPVDPTNSVAGTARNELVYKYRCNNAGGVVEYELNANMESVKYSGVEVDDGGSYTDVYEIGNKLNI